MKSYVIRVNKEFERFVTLERNTLARRLGVQPTKQNLPDPLVTQIVLRKMQGIPTKVNVKKSGRVIIT